MLDFELICIWPDYDWCFYEHLEEYLAFKSDDFVVRKYYSSYLPPSYEDIINLIDF